MNEPLSASPQPSSEEHLPETHHSLPSVERQSWGAVISIIIIVLMIVVGAFYAWGKRLSELRVETATTTLP
jgi:hypothetical protein